MKLVNFTAIGAYLVYWLKFIVGAILFIRGEYSLSASVLIIGVAIEVVLYTYTARN